MQGLDIYFRSCDVVARLENNGVKVDTNKSRKGFDACNKLSESKKELWKKAFGFEFKRSPVQLKNIFDQYGWKYNLSEKGNPVFNKEALDEYEMDDRARTLLKDLSKLQTLAATYETFWKTEEDCMGWLFPSYNTIRTGRFSCSNPNLQNLPRDSYKGSLRDCIISPWKYSVVAMDYSQGEYRLFADYLGNQKIIDQMNDGGDFHQMTADLSGVTRQEAKNVNFALIYGASDKRLSKMIKQPLYETTKISRKVRGLFGVEYKQLMDGIKRSEIVKKWSGIEVEPPFYHARLNYLIQGGLADIVRLAMIKNDDYIRSNNLGRWISLYMNIHDELIYVVANHIQNKKAHIKALRDNMETCYPSFNGIKMKVDVSVSEKETNSIDKGELNEYIV